MSNEARAAVSAILKSAMVAFTVTYAGQRKRDNWDFDAWVCVFEKQSRENPAKPYERQEFDYSTGLGLRKPDDSVMAKMSARSLAKVSKRVLAWEHHYKHFPGKPVAPHPADVLHCLLSDSEVGTQTFAEWCDNFGMNADSRKALATYEACQQTADKLNRLFNSTQRTALADALQDY